MLFTTPRVGAYISGAILFDETIRQQTTDGTPMAEVLAKQGVVPGIKVDEHTTPLAAFADDEQITEGLDGLRERTEDIYKIYAESFRGADHLRRILEEAQTIVSDTLAVLPEKDRGVAS